jgi:hypothetical protein
MRKLLVLKLDGDIIEGVRATLNVEEHGNHPDIEITGYLPANQELATALNQWQSNYRSWGRSYRIKAIVTERQWRQDCYSSAKELHQQLNRWLLSQYGSVKAESRVN